MTMESFPLQVTLADRALFILLFAMPERHHARILSGDKDSTVEMQLLAQHRLLEAQPEALRERIRDEVINSPETADFMAGVPLEAAHQRDRWDSAHDAGKTPEDWFWLIGYLAQKALRAQNAGDTHKALHHTISTAAALANWHAALSGADTSMRPGIQPPLSASDQEGRADG